MKLNEDTIERDIEILKNGPICKYYKNTILDEDIKWFLNNNYEVIELNVRNWTRKNAHKNLKEALNFPDYYGENLNAFNDCIGDLYNKRYKGLLLVFRSYDHFVDENRSFAESILDSITYESRIWLLTGQKLIGLVQSNNPDLEFSKLGGINPGWNSYEWLNSNRKKQ